MGGNLTWGKKREAGVWKTGYPTSLLEDGGGHEKNVEKQGISPRKHNVLFTGGGTGGEGPCQIFTIRTFREKGETSVMGETR